MGLLKNIVDALIGKTPDIYDEGGGVVHKLPKKKWDAWNNKFKTDSRYNWRNHTGTQAGANTSKTGK